MAKKLVSKELRMALTVFALQAGFLLTACVSTGVASQGKEYFVGKKESVIVKYFDGEAASIGDEEGIYDKISWFTNKKTSVVVTKDNVKQYKAANRRPIYTLQYSESSYDGCRWGERQFQHFSTRMVEGDSGIGNISNRSSRGYRTIVEHRPGENDWVNSQIAGFNDQIKRLRCVDSSEENIYLSSSNVGDTFYTFQINTSSRMSGGAGSGLGGDSEPPETITFYNCQIYEVSVGLIENIETEQHTAAWYDERTNATYDEKGSIISEEQVENITQYYINKGFKSSISTEGLSVLAYIKDGKVVKVEDSDALVNSGNANKNLGNYDQAIADYTAALRINPNLAEAYFYRAMAYYNKGQYDQAITDYNAVLRINPNLAGR